MADYELSVAAAADLEDVFVYTIQTFGIAQAERYRSTLETALQRVANDPRLGRPVEGRTQVFRQYNCESHGIFYVIEGDAIFVVRILHLAMDFTRHLPK
jgi:toxin ParE1/3/4